jgi:hypothetical protein
MPAGSGRSDRLKPHCLSMSGGHRVMLRAAGVWRGESAAEVAGAGGCPAPWQMTNDKSNWGGAATYHARTPAPRLQRALRRNVMASSGPVFRCAGEGSHHAVVVSLLGQRKRQPKSDCDFVRRHMCCRGLRPGARARFSSSSRALLSQLSADLRRVLSRLSRLSLPRLLRPLRAWWAEEDTCGTERRKIPGVGMGAALPPPLAHVGSLRCRGHGSQRPLDPGPARRDPSPRRGRRS